MSVDRVSSGMEQGLSEAPASRPNLWQRLRGQARSAVLFAAGVCAALIALLLYDFLFPDPQYLTAREVSDSVAQALASATPAPAFSARVYQAVQPSLVLVQAQVPGTEGEAEQGLGSGVVVNDRRANLLLRSCLPHWETPTP